MATYSVNTQRLDPYKNYKFRLNWDGRYICRPIELTELKATSGEVVKHRAGGDPSTSQKSPGRSRYDAVVLERGLVEDASFQNWASAVWSYGSNLGAEVSLAAVRKNVYLEISDGAGQPVARYTIDRCWPWTTKGLPSLFIILHSPTGFHPALARFRLER
ncbi:MAG TPA: phage tail protein [Roseiarcus sp.]|nr:phage tail protein [Roseiarcus sp.]